MFRARQWFRCRPRKCSPPKGQDLCHETLCTSYLIQDGEIVRRKNTRLRCHVAKEALLDDRLGRVRVDRAEHVVQQDLV
jgi:hypothetical protein